jgi:hypothetical protein
LSRAYGLALPLTPSDEHFLNPHKFLKLTFKLRNSGRPRGDRHVGEVLLWTLERGLGEGFTPEVRSARAQVYGVLAATMQAGATDVAELRAADDRVIRRGYAIAGMARTKGFHSIEIVQPADRRCDHLHQFSRIFGTTANSRP